MSRLSVKTDNVKAVLRSLQDLVGQQVLVGIPESTDSRDNDSGPVNNATLGYIHEFGSPAANIPARPFLIPGVESIEGRAAEQLKKAAQSAVAGDSKKATQYLNAAGSIGQSGARDKINSGPFVPLKPSTIRNRHRGRGTASMRQSEQDYLKMIASGMDPQSAQDAAGIKPLIDTGQLRNSITYVVRKR